MEKINFGLAKLSSTCNLGSFNDNVIHPVSRNIVLNVFWEVPIMCCYCDTVTRRVGFVEYFAQRYFAVTLVSMVPRHRVGPCQKTNYKT